MHSQRCPGRGLFNLTFRSSIVSPKRTGATQRDWTHKNQDGNGGPENKLAPESASRQIKMFNNHKITSIEEVALVEGDAATNTDARLEPSNVRFAEWLSHRVR